MLHFINNRSSPMIKVLMMAFMVMLSGCGLMWINEKTPTASYDQDNVACENEAIRSVPPTIYRPPAQAEAYAPQSYQTNCSRSGTETSCTTRPDTPRSPGKLTSFMNGLNSGQENSNSSNVYQYTKNCLTTKGWKQVRKK